MYSLVLMAAMTTSPATPACHWGCKACSSCYGCWGCYGCGGCWGYSYGCYGCAGCYGCYGGGYGYYGCYGCYGGACYGLSTYGPVYTAPGTTTTPPATGPAAPEKVPAPKPEKTGAAPSQAKLIVQLPTDAKLYIDDHLMKTTSGQRVFRTPQLEKEQAYYYILRAEYVRDGKTQTATKRVIVRAGQEIRASFDELKTPAEMTASAGR